MTYFQLNFSRFNCNFKLNKINVFSLKVNALMIILIIHVIPLSLYSCLICCCRSVT